MPGLFRRKVKIYLSEAAIKQIGEECANFKDVETGGILIGYHVSNSIVINQATGPGPNAVHRIDSLTMDLEYITRELRRHERQRRWGYEGNWHTHPKAKRIIPSETDIALMRDVVDSGSYDVDSAVCLITTELPKNLSDLHTFVFRRRTNRFREIAAHSFPLLITY